MNATNDQAKSIFLSAAEIASPEERRAFVEAQCGGDRQRIPFNAAEIAADAPSQDLLALDESLRRLEEHDPAAAKLVKLRYFAGMTMPQAAEALGMSLRTAERNWTYARSWLRRDLS